MNFTVEETARLNALQQKAARKEASLEELREAFRLLRQGRAAAQASSTSSRTKAAAARAPVDGTSALAGLKALAATLKTGPVA